VIQRYQDKNEFLTELLREKEAVYSVLLKQMDK
jgi:hypothetical protein